MKLITLKAVLKKELYTLCIGRQSIDLCREEFDQAFDLQDREETIEAVELVVYSDETPTRFQVDLVFYRRDCDIDVYPYKEEPVLSELCGEIVKALARALKISVRKNEGKIRKTVWIMPYIIYTPK